MWCDETERYRRVNQSAIDIIKNYEPLLLTPKQSYCGILVIGWGHTRCARENMKITKDMAEVFLQEDMKIVGKMVMSMAEVLLNDNQFSALCVFAHQVGSHNLSVSKLIRLLNRGWYDQVPAQLMRWTKLNDKEIPEARSRRAAEARLWQQIDDAMNSMQAAA